MNDSTNTTHNDVPAALAAELPRGTDLSKCVITTYGELYADHDISGDEHADIDDDAIVIVVPGYTADDGNAEMYYPAAHSAQDAAQSYTDEGDFVSVEATQWNTVYAWQTGYVLCEDGESAKLTIGRDRYTSVIEPTEPDCVRGNDHDWHQPDYARGHGGGAVYREVCARCGARKVTDTWAQDMSTGEQGLTSVSYEDADAVSLAWADGLRMTAARDAAFALLEDDDRIVSYINDDDEAVAVITAILDGTDVDSLERDINRALRDADCHVDSYPTHMPDGAVLVIRLDADVID